MGAHDSVLSAASRLRLEDTGGCALAGILFGRARAWPNLPVDGASCSFLIFRCPAFRHLCTLVGQLGCFPTVPILVFVVRGVDYFSDTLWTSVWRGSQTQILAATSLHPYLMEWEFRRNPLICDLHVSAMSLRGGLSIERGAWHLASRAHCLSQ